MCQHCARLRQLYMHCAGFRTARDGTLLMLVGGKGIAIARVRCFDKPEKEGWTMFYPVKSDGLYTVLEEDARKEPRFYKETTTE
jgi:hypothetical protein